MAERKEISDGMQIEWDVPITMDDGVVLRADIFRPMGDGKYPVIITYGPYGKGLDFKEGYKTAYEILESDYPDSLQGTSGKYLNWEVVDPEKWVPDGYVCIRVDSRGAGRSPGFMDVHGPRETKDLYTCIEWAGVQPWSNGKVGMNGISYYGANQWRVAALQPPHLAAICIWEGFSDNYRDNNRHGGILCVFRKNWQDMQVKTVQHGLGERGRKSKVTGDWVSGPETLTDEEMIANRSDLWGDLLRNDLDGEYYRSRAGDDGQDRRAAPLLRQLGRAGIASARQHRGLRQCRLEAEMARGAWRRALGRVLYGLWRRHSEEVPRPFPEGREYGLGQAAQGDDAAPPAGADQIPVARRE